MRSAALWAQNHYHPKRQQQAAPPKLVSHLLLSVVVGFVLYWMMALLRAAHARLHLILRALHLVLVRGRNLGCLRPRVSVRTKKSYEVRMGSKDCEQTYTSA